MKQAITTQKVNCQDCHRCVRSCPVKAIGIEAGHASVVLDKCILCGECVVECPQNAKQVENQLDSVQRALAVGDRVAFSIAPSFVAAFPELTIGQLRTALKRLGACAVEETAVGAAAVSEVYSDLVATTEAPRAAQLESGKLDFGREAVDGALASLQVGGHLVQGQDFTFRFCHRLAFADDE